MKDLQQLLRLAQSLGRHQHIPDDQDTNLRFRLARHWLANAQALLTAHGRHDLAMRLYTSDFTHPLVSLSGEVLDAVYVCATNNIMVVSLADDSLENLTEIALVHACHVYSNAEGRPTLPRLPKTAAHLAYAERLLEIARGVRMYGPAHTRALLNERAHERSKAIRKKAKYILPPR